jgi:CBS domain containing-hemolysin-like protein
MLALLISIACLALNAFFVAAEFAIVKVRITQVRPRARRGDRRAQRAEAILSKLDRYLSVTQVGITVASLGLGWVAEPALERLGDLLAVRFASTGLGQAGHVVVGVVGLGTLTFLHVLVGELVPKAVAIRHSESVALATAFPLRLANAVFWPILWVLERAQRGVLRLLHVDPDASESSLTEDELVGILAAGAMRGQKTTDKQRILERVLRFEGRTVGNLMVPRVDVIALSIDSSGADAFDVLKRHEFSRVPLFSTSVDAIVGYLYAKDFLLDEHARSRPTLRGLSRPVLFTPEGRNGLSVLREMQRKRIPLAIVVDEYGGTRGIVTMEDLVEEVFGEIRDELDAEHEMVTPLGEPASAWDVDASATVDELREAGVPLPELGHGEPVGKLVLESHAHLPHVGDHTSLSEGVDAEVIAASERRIERLRVRIA